MTHETDRELLELAAKAAGKRERHGMHNTSEHRAWVSMKQRCTNPKKREWLHYGGRGIKVCEKWASSFIAFLRDVGMKPSPLHSLDRIDVNGNYEPGNVRWATHQQQVENTRTVRLVSINGKTQSHASWARENGLSTGQIASRIKAGWSEIEAITTPSIKAQKIHKYVPQGYTKLKTGWFRVKVNGKYIKTVKTEEEAKLLVSEVRAAAEIGRAMP